MSSNYPTVLSGYTCIKCGQKNDHWIMNCNISKFTTINRIEHLVMGYMTKEFTIKNRQYQQVLNTVIIQFITNIFIDLLHIILNDIQNKKDSIWIFKYLSAIISTNEQQQINEIIKLNNTHNFNLSDTLIQALWVNDFDIRHGAYNVIRHYIPIYESKQYKQLPTIEDSTLCTLKNLIKLPEYVHGCNSDDPKKQFENIYKIRKLLSSDMQAIIQFVIDSSIIPRFVEFLKNNSFPQLQFEAAWCLTNIAAGSSDQIAVVIKHGALPILIELIISNCYEVQEQAIWALGNIAGDGIENRNIVLEHNILENVLKLCGQKPKNDQHKVVLRNLTWTISNLCRGIPPADMKYIIVLTQALAIMIQYNDDEILQDCCWAYSYLSETPKHIKYIMNKKVTDVMVTLIILLEHTSPHIRHPVVKTISNIIVSVKCDKYYQRILKKIGNILSNDGSGSIKREAFDLISNIADSKENISQIISANLGDVLLNGLLTESLAKKALFAISNIIANGSDLQIQFFVDGGIISKLCSCQLPKRQISDRIVLMECLKTIENILISGSLRNKNENSNKYAKTFEVFGVVDWFKQLQSNEEMANEINDKINSIREMFFE